MSNFWNKRIPTLGAFLLIVIGIAVTSYLTVTGVIPFGHAAPEENPKDIRITNIIDTSFTITYKTDTAVIGSATFGTDPSFGQVALDDRDQSTGIPTQRVLHSITIRNLKPNTKYFYAVASGRTTYLNRGSPFITVTGPRVTASPSLEVPLAGSIQSVSGDKPDESLVYVSTQNGQTLSTLTKANGLYIIPINGMRNTALSSYIQFTDTTTLDVLVVSGTAQSRATLLASKRNPVPLITLSNNYDFTLDIGPLSTTSPSSTGFPDFPLDTTIQAEPKIETPLKNETFTDPQPMLRGKALPNGTVQIEIHSQDVISKTVQADQFGNWTFRPSTALPPGQHTITVVTKDKFGIVQTLQQVFTIFASGTQVAEAATPSASPTIVITPSPTSVPTRAPTITLTLSPTLTPSPTPGITISPTPTLIPSPSESPTPTVVMTITPTSTQKLPPTGSNAGIIIGTATLVTTVAGIVLFLLSSGISL